MSKVFKKSEDEDMERKGKKGVVKVKEKLRMISPDGWKNKNLNGTEVQASSSEIMTNINRSLTDLFSKIEKIKHSHIEESARAPFSTATNIPHPNNFLKQTKSQRKLDAPPPAPPQIHFVSPPKEKTIWKISELKTSLEFSSIPVPFPANNSVKISEFELGKCIGSGKYGDVFACRHKKTNTIYALKKILKSTIKQYQMEAQFITQLKIHYSLQHPNIIKLYTHFDDEYHIFLLMEYATDGTAMQFLQCQEEKASVIIGQTIQALNYMHEQSIIHRDLKPENMVLGFNEVKLCDFGWSAIIGEKMKRTFCGTLDYLSPEMKDIGEYDNRVDLWSLGVLAYELLVGVPPHKDQISKWKDKGSRRSMKWEWKDIKYPEYVSLLAQSFINNLLIENPHYRSTLPQCYKHYFIQKNQKENPKDIFNQFKNLLL